MSVKLSRRQFLRGTSGLLVPLPVLASLLPKKSLAAGAPTLQPIQINIAARMSVPYQAWFPDSFLKSDPMTIGRKPEEFFQKELSSLTGATAPAVFAGGWDQWCRRMFMPAGIYESRGDCGHNPCSVSFGGNTPGLEWTTAEGPIKNPPPPMATLDVVYEDYRRSLGKLLPFDVLRINNGKESSGYGETPGFSHAKTAGPRSFIPSYGDPQTLWDALFKNFQTGSAPAADPRLRVVDSVNADANRLKTQVSSADRYIVDAFLATIADIENKLKTLAGGSTSSGAVCSVPPRPTVGDISHLPVRDPAITVSGRLMADIAVMAAYCGLSRWICMANARPLNFDYSGIHNSSHGGPRELQIEYFKWIADNYFFRSMQQMSGLPTADGLTMLDHALVVMTSEHSGDGQAHSHGQRWLIDEYGVYTVMGGGNAIPQGKFYNYGTLLPRTSATSPYPTGRTGIFINSYFNTLLQAMGVPPSFYEAHSGTGKPGYGSFENRPANWAVWGPGAATSMDNGVRLAGAILPGCTSKV